MTVAELGFRIDSAQAVSAKGNLEKMSAASAQAEAATKRLAGTARTASGQWETYEQAVARLGIKTKEMDTVSRAATSAVTQLNAGMTREAGNARAVAQAQTMVATATEKAAVATRSLTIAAGAARMHSRQLMYQLVDMGQAIPLAFQSPIYALQNFGFQFAQVGQLYYGQGGMKAALRDSIVMVGRFAAKLGPIALVAGAVAAAIAGMTHEINQASDVTVTFGDTALAVWQTIRDGLYNALQPAINAIAPWFASTWDTVVSGAKTAINTVVGGFVGGYEAVKLVWNQFPDLIGEIGKMASWKLGVEFRSMLRDQVIELNKFMQSVANAMGFEKAPSINPNSVAPEYRKQGGKLVPTHPKPQLSDAGQAAFDEVSKAFTDAASKDYAGEFFDTVKGHATANALKRIAEDAKGAGKSLKDAAKGALPAWMHFGKATDAARDAMRFVGRTARNFVDDFTNGLKNGESVWRSFADAALNALDRIANKLLDDAFSSLFGGGGSGGLLSSLFGLGGGGTGYFPPAPAPAIGLFASGTPSAPAGLAIVGEKGPELVRFRGGEEVIPNHRLRAANDSAANQNAPHPVYINVNVSGARGNTEISQMVERGVRSGIDEFSRKGLPVRVQQIRNDPRARG